jgi:hypothetical protein
VSPDARADFLDRTIWAKFEEQPFVLEVHRDAGRLLIEEPHVGRYDPSHRITVSVSASELAADWDALLTGKGRLSSLSGSDGDMVVDEIIERLWDAAMVTGSAGTHLEWRDAYFNAVVPPNQAALPNREAHESKWVTSEEAEAIRRRIARNR